ncbi:uncharacterized protein LOC142182326 [Nicotiana tabacum]|uniref:Uncharacterized protein LOC142182326 n=1 Tax=Nicotiana tabacum TaxID=4097 RepID=A0AC58UT55_TOBAC
MSGFAKYLKDLITKKRTTKNEVVNVTHRVSSIIATFTIQKKEDPGAFTIPCTIGAHDFERALCDNGDSINLMPLAIYKQAGLGMPRPTSIRLQMADRLWRPVGVVDDVLVKVGKFYLPTDFVILDYAVDKEIPIILGRQFLATGRALIDSEQNEIKFRMDDEEVTFQASRGMKLPHEYESILVIDVVDEVEDAVEMKVEEQRLGKALAAIYMESVNALEGLGSYTYDPAKLSLDLENRATPPAKPSIIEPPQLELKPLPPHLRYKFLGSNDTLPVEQLLDVLKEHSQAIGWTIVDIRGIPAGICEHKIQLENETKPSAEHQQWLNLSMQKVPDAIWFVQRSGYFSEIHYVHLLRHGGGFSRGFHGRLFGEVDRAKIKIISKLPPPTSVKSVRSFLGHARFYRRFIKDFSKIGNLMCKLLEKDAKFVFDEKCLKAFEELKQKLTTAPIIATPDWSLPFELMCDASGVAIGAVLGQCHNKILHLAYFLGSKVIVYTDRASLRYLMEKKDAKTRLIWLEEAGRPKEDLEINYAFPDEHILALSNTFAHWYVDIANYLVSDLIPDGLESYQKKKFLRDCRQYYWEEPFLFHVCADNIIRRCVLEEEIMPILKAWHDSPVGGHHGGNRMAAKVLECGYYCPSIYHDANQMVKACDQCQRQGSISKSHEMPMHSVMEIEILDVWGIDFMGPFVALVV